MLKEKIQQDLMQSLKKHDSDRVSVLRQMSSEFKNAEINSGKPLSDDEMLMIIKKEVKKLKDAAEMFRNGDREELALQNEAQIEIMNEFLPEEISDEGLSEAIDKLIAENKELFDSNPNAIIGKVMGKLKTDADPSRIMSELKKRMSQ